MPEDLKKHFICEESFLDRASFKFITFDVTDEKENLTNTL